MRFVVWTCRVIMAAVIVAFVATVFYVTHDVGTHMDGAKPVLNLITVAGAALVGFIWPLLRRYWQGLMLLVSLLVMRGLFGRPEIPGPSLETPLLTPFQSDFLWIPIGVVALMLVVTLVARAVASDRKLRALKQAAVAAAPKPAPVVAAADTVVPPAALVVTEPEPAVAAPEAPGAAPEESTAEPVAVPGRWRKK
jgi:hypothetical protein